MLNSANLCTKIWRKRSNITEPRGKKLVKMVSDFLGVFYRSNHTPLHTNDTHTGSDMIFRFQMQNHHYTDQDMNSR